MYGNICGDPLEKLCSFGDMDQLSFSFEPEQREMTTEDFDNILPPMYINKHTEILLPSITFTTSEKADNIIKNSLFINDREYNVLLDEIRKVNNLMDDEFKKASTNSNKLRDLPARFVSNDSYIIANVQTIYGIYGITDNNPTLASNYKHRFVTVNDGPGAWTEYTRWLMQNSEGWGISPVKGPYKWNFKSPPDNFHIYTGTLNRSHGSIEREWKEFTEHLKSKGERIDLFLANGENKLHQNNIPNMIKLEINNYRLLCAEIYSALSVLVERSEKDRKDFAKSQPLSIEEIEANFETLKDEKVVFTGGQMIIKIPSSLTRVTCELIYLVSFCFETITLFKPIVTNQSDPNKYLICLNYHSKEKAKPIIELLEEVLEHFDTNMDEVPVKLLKNVSTEFGTWMRYVNKMQIDMQISALAKILISAKSGVGDVKLDIGKLMLLLEFPGTSVY